MLVVAQIRENKEEVIRLLNKRGEDFTNIIDKVIELDDKRKESQVKLDNVLAESNVFSKEIGALFQAGKQEEANEKKAQTAELKNKAQQLKEQQGEIEKALRDELFQLPNIPNELVPEGKTEDDNDEIFSHGDKPNLGDNKQPHWELAEKFDLIRFDAGVKISGAGFPLYTGKGAKLQRALINFFLDKAIDAGYQEFIPPHLVNEDSAFGTGQLPDKEGQMYHMQEDNLFLIPTAEVPITNVYRDVILKEDDFPIKMCGYTPCFRREAGSYGKDVRGLNRLHQFDKVEIVRIAHPDNSYEVLDEMVEHVKSLLNALELPYRIVRLCGGDLGFAAAMTYDFEVFSAGQDRWLEVSSVSNFETFQANRLKLRFKDESKKTRLAHTLNGSAMALARIYAALLENNQNKDAIEIPKALQSYTGFNKISS